MSKHKISDGVFAILAALVTRRPWAVVAVFLALTVMAVLTSTLWLESRTDQNELMSSDLPYNVRYQEFLNRFGDLEYLYAVIVVGDDPQRAARAADLLAAEVAKVTEHVQSVFHKVPSAAFGNALLLLSPFAELKSLAAMVVPRAGLLQALRQPASLAGQVEAMAGLLDEPKELEGGSFARLFFAFIDVTLEAMQTAANGSTPPSLLPRLEGAIDEAEKDPLKKGYIFSENGKLAFVHIMPRKDFKTLEVIRQPLYEVRAAIDRVRGQFPGLEIGLTGRPVLQADEMSTTNQDMTWSTALATLLVLGLTVVFFRRVRRPLLAVISLLVAVAITLGLVTVIIGHLTLLSMVFAVMMIGLGCDLGTLFLVRYQEELIKHGQASVAISSTLVTAGLGIWTGGITTACTFFSAMLVPFKGLAELGFVAGMGLIVCIVTMLTLLPALIVLTDRWLERRRALRPPRPIAVPGLEHASRFPRLVLAIVALVTLAGFIDFRGVTYNSNLLDLQVRDLESVRFEKLIPELSGRSTWFAAFIKPSLEATDEVVAALKPLQEQGVVGVVESARAYVPLDQPAKLELLASVREALARAPVPPPQAFDAGALRGALERLVDKLDTLQSQAASRGASAAEAVRSLNGLIARAEAIVETIETGTPEVIPRLAAHQPRWLAESRELAVKLDGYLDPRPIVPAGLPQVLRDRFVSRDGREHLVYAYPSQDVWEEAPMEKFITALRAIDPDVTGAPITTFESAKIIKRGFLLAGLYSLGIVFVFLLIDFRSLKFALLTMAPVLLGLTWAFQLMPRLGLELNLANFFALPILLGCAVDGCVHMLHRYRECGSVGEAVRTTGSAVCLAALSNLLGFLAMGIARHRGLASLGFLTALGCGTILVASVVFLPSLLAVVGGRRENRR